MLATLTKNDLNQDILAGRVNVKRFIDKPKGIICQLYTAGESNHLINGTYHHVNTELGNYLTSLGVEGHLVICHRNIALPDLSTWLMRVLTKEYLDDWAIDIVIYTTSPGPWPDNRIKILPMSYKDVNVNTVEALDRELDNEDASLDSWLIEAVELETGTVRTYQVFTSYYLSATILSLSGPPVNQLTGFIVKTRYDGASYTFPVKLNKDTVLPNDIDKLLGRECVVRYRRFVPGICLCNFYRAEYVELK
jgi:hypothetical protein